jgi:hypothetical protein
VSIVVAILTLVLLAAVIVIVSGPLLRRRGAGAREPGEHLAAARSELEAEREAKYREIREAELDLRTGKLSPDDHALVSATLRAEAVAILDRLAALERELRPGRLEQEDRVQQEQDREEDRPAV